MIISFSKRRIAFMLMDMLAINVAFVLALSLRFDSQVPIYWMDMYAYSFWAYNLISLVIFSYCQFYEHDWRYMTTRNIIRFAGGVLLGVLGYVLFLYFIDQATFPRTVIVMQVLLATAFVGGLRLCIHLNHFWRNKSFARKAKKIIIIGAGDAGEGLVRDILSKSQSPYIPVGFLDDDLGRQGILLHGVPVLGKIADVKRIVKQIQAEMIIIAIPSARNDLMKEIASQCNASGIEVKKVPSLVDILDGRVNISEIRNVEPEDILGRELNIGKDDDIAQYLFGKVVLVTGAGGSIGSELCRQIIRYNPVQVILLDSSEFNLYTINNELSESLHYKQHVPVLANIQSEQTIDSILDYFKPDMIFHAAAYKHVPLMEVNVSEAVKNNIWGTRNIAFLAAKHKVKRFIMISSDKAVNPVNVMGVSKRIAEMIIQSMGQENETKFSAVRFGNVLNSSGSVLPLFKKQIASGGPVTVTHPEVVRYFMTIPEAVHLVLTTATLAKGSEIYVLEMGAPVKILDMAQSLIRLSGLEPHKDIEIKFTGLRPGEKLYEELLTEEEGIRKTDCDRIYIGKSMCIDQKKLFTDVEELWQLANKQKIPLILSKFKQIVPEANFVAYPLDEIPSKKETNQGYSPFRWRPLIESRPK